jgi:Secretion system C-terminal sorting domain
MKSFTMYIFEKRFQPFIWLSFLLCGSEMRAQTVKTNMTSNFYTTYCYLENEPLTGYTYVATDNVGGTPTTLNFSGNNDGSSEITLPVNFDFTFYCEKISKIRIGVDGIMLLDDATTTIPSNNIGQIKSIQSKVVAPFFDELQLGNGTVTYQYKGTIGSTSNPYRLIVHWNNVSLAALNDFNVKIDFWAVFIPDTDEIIYYYKDVKVIDDITNLNDQGIIGSHEFGKDASFGLRSLCGTGDFFDKVNNAANAIQNGVSLKDFNNTESIVSFRFTPKLGVCPSGPISAENFTVCEDVPAFDLPIKTIAINGNWEGNGVAYVTPNPATTSDINGIVAKFDPLDPGFYKVTWNPGCSLFKYDVNVRVDDRLNIFPPPAQLSGCGQTTFTVNAEYPSVLTAGVPQWTSVGTSTSPVFPLVAPNPNTITIGGVSGTVNLTLTNGTCVTNTSVTNLPSTSGGAAIDIPHCGGSVGVTLSDLGATDLSWSFLTPPPAGVGFNPNPPVSNTATVVGLPATAGTVIVKVGYKSGGKCLESLFNLNGGSGEVATVGGSSNATQTIAQCNNGTFVLTATDPTLPSVGKWEFVGTPAAGVTMTPSVSPNNPVTISGVPTGVDVIVRWVVGVPSGSSLSCSDTVIVTLKNFPPVTAAVNLGVTEQCGNGLFNLSAVNPAPYTGFWEKVSGNGVISSPSSFSTSISGVTATTVVKWVVYSSSQFGAPCRDSAVVTLTNNPKPVASLGTFVRDKCNATDALAGTAGLFTVIGVLPTGAQGEWHYASNKVLISTNTTTGVIVPVGMIENIYWVVFTPKCRDSIFVTLRNDAPVTASVTANNPQCNNPTFNINATPAATGSWSKISGSGTITSASSASTTVTGVTAGSTTIVRWTVTGGTCSNSTADVTLRNDAPSSVVAGSNINRCESEGLTVDLVATVVGTGSWTVVPVGALTFTSPNSPTTQATVAAAFVGTDITATFCATNGVCPQACGNLNIKIDKNVTSSISVVPANAQCENGGFTLTGNTPSVFTSKTWSKVSADNNVTLPSDLTQSVINVTNLPAGQSVTMRWTTTNGSCTSSSQVILTNIAKPKVVLREMNCMPVVNLDGLITELVGNGTWSALGASVGTFSGGTHSVLSGTTNHTTYTPSIEEVKCGEANLQISVQNPSCPDVVTATIKVKFGTAILVVKDLNLSLAYDANNCQYTFNSSSLLNKDYKHFTIRICDLGKISNPNCDCAGRPSIPNNTIDASFIGKTVGVEVSDACGNRATSCVKVEDKQKPIITCPKDVAVLCNTQVALSADKPDKSLTGDLGLDGITPPAPAMDGSDKDCSQIVEQNSIDECSFITGCATPYTEGSKPTVADILACLKGTNVNAVLAQELRDRMLTAGGDVVKFIIRRWTAMDAFGNISEPCYQVIAIRRLPFKILAPANRKYSCNGDVVECNPDILAAPTSLASSTTGLPYVDMNNDGIIDAGDIALNTEGARACQMIVAETEVEAIPCKGSKKIERTFRILDGCSGKDTTVTQTIEVLDLTPPVVRSEYVSYERVAKKYCYVDRLGAKSDKISYDLVAKPEVLTNFTGKQITTCNYDDAGTTKTLLALGDANNCDRYFVKFRFVACDHFCTKDLVTITSNQSTITGRRLTAQDFVDANGVPNYVWEFSGFLTADDAFFDADYAYGEGECLRQGANCKDITFTAKDVCNNAFGKQTFRVYMIDNQKPLVNCISSLTASLSTNGTDRIAAANFNNGTMDNCGVVGYKVRRMDKKYFYPATIDGVDCVQPFLEDTCYRDFVEFTCEDVDKEIMVEMLACDDNCNTNSCMVIVKVQNKNRPLCVAPQAETTSCVEIAQKIANPSAFFTSTASAFYNCGYKIEEIAATGSVDRCGNGTLTRTWVVKNCTNNAELSRCQQFISVVGKSDFSVDFPDDLVVSCQGQIPSIQCLKDQMTNPNSWANGYDGAVKNDGCGVILVSIKDDTLMSNAANLNCGVIYRTICVYDDCKFPANGVRTQGLSLNGEVHGYGTSGKSLSCSVLGATPKLATSPSRFRDADGLAGAGNSDGVICYIQTIRIEDNTPPVGTETLDQTVGLDPKKCTVNYSRTLSATDGCTAATRSGVGLRYNWFVYVKEADKDPNNYTLLNSGETNQVTLNNLAAGTYFVSWFAKDMCNNSTPQYSYTLTVRDNEGASIVSIPKKNAVLGGISGSNNGMATVCVSDFWMSASDNCTKNPNTLRQNARLVRETDANRANPVYPTNANDTCVMVSCADVNRSIPVQLWAKDEAGNANFVVDTVDVQDNRIPKVCTTGGPGIAVARGSIVTDNNMVIQNARILASLKGNNVAFTSGVTSASGGFEINNLVIGQSYDFKVAKEDELFAGVTTLDISLISRHLLEINKLKTPCSIIAADVDGNRSVDGADMLHIRNFILRKTSSLPAGAWKFIDKKHAFINPNEPLNEDFPEVVSVENVAQNVLLGFTAIKLGDINGTYRPQTSVAPTPRSNNVLIFQTDDIALEAGKTYTIKLTSSDFKAADYQFTLGVSEGVASVKSVDLGNLPNMSSSNFAVFKNAITTSWNGLAKGSEVEALTLTFVAHQNAKLSEVLTINSAITPMDATNTEGSPLKIQLAFGNGVVKEAGEFALYQNRPNPMTTTTAIGFNLPKESEATLTIYNIEGKVMKVVNSTFKAGYNEVVVEKENFQTAGVYYYRLETSEHSATKKMVVQF